MTAPAKEPTAVTAPAKQEKAMDPRVAEAKALREITLAIRGQQWGADCSPAVQHAVARYCLKNGLDAVRHVEVLGGRIYLTGEFYEEKGIPLVLSGAVVLDEPQFVQDDTRLAALASGSDEDLAQWAKGERVRRIKARIEYGIPDDCTGGCIQRARVQTENGLTVIVGFNWCGGETKTKKKRDGTKYRHDPVGDAEPVKTAQSRAKRRMWRQIVVALPEMQDRVGAIEANVRIANAELAEVISTETTDEPSKQPAALLVHGENAYETGVKPEAEPVPVKAGAPPYIANLIAREKAGEVLGDTDADELRLWREDQEEATR